MFCNNTVIHALILGVFLALRGSVNDYEDQFFSGTLTSLIIFPPVYLRPANELHSKFILH